MNTQTYILQVYGVVLSCIISYFTGAFFTLPPLLSVFPSLTKEVDFSSNVNGFITVSTILTILALALMICVAVVTDRRYLTARLITVNLITWILGLVSSFALTEIHKHLDPSIIPTALLITIAVFASLSTVVFFFPSPLYQALMGPCLSALTVFCLLSIVNYFVNSVWLWRIELYGGTILFALLIVVDTHFMLADRLQKDQDPDIVYHGLSLALDFINLFIRIVIILAELKSKDKNKDKKKQR
jgi:FtsH-binding integral membrane protein